MCLPISNPDVERVFGAVFGFWDILECLILHNQLM